MEKETCPFCGCADVVVETWVAIRFVRCRKCKACGPEISRYEDGKARQNTSTSIEAVTAWNKRHYK